MTGQHTDLTFFTNDKNETLLGRFTPKDRDYGFVITGSSNFPYSGLVANREFNVQVVQTIREALKR